MARFSFSKMAVKPWKKIDEETGNTREIYHNFPERIQVRGVKAQT